MFRYIISRFKKEPIRFIRRSFFKIVIGPLKYGTRTGYDAQRYWADRFRTYHTHQRSAGCEGYSKEENEDIYAEKIRALENLDELRTPSLPQARVLCIGIGTGFEMRFFAQAGVRNLTGVDVTDELFPELKKEFPHYSFLKKDITKDSIEQQFNIVTCIDVIEHITSQESLTTALHMIKNTLSETGILILSPLAQHSRKTCFNFHTWTYADIEPLFKGYRISQPIALKHGSLVVIKK